MRRRIVRWAARFFEKDRGVVLHFLAVAFLFFIESTYRRDRDRHRRLFERYDIDLGRINLLINMIGGRL